MLRAEIDWQACQACSPCLAYKSCKLHALIQFEPGEVAYIDVSRCNGCSNCVPICPHAAIKLANHATTSQH